MNQQILRTRVIEAWGTELFTDDDIDTFVAAAEAVLSEHSEIEPAGAWSDTIEGLIQERAALSGWRSDASHEIWKVWKSHDPSMSASEFGFTGIPGAVRDYLWLHDEDFPVVGPAAHRYLEAIFGRDRSDWPTEIEPELVESITEIADAALFAHLKNPNTVQVEAVSSMLGFIIEAHLDLALLDRGEAKLDETDRQVRLGFADTLHGLAERHRARRPWLASGLA